MPLVLIESPNKISKLRKILGSNYTIMASVGHIMDLSKKNLGIDTETFEATYKVNSDKKDVVKSIKMRLKNTTQFILLQTLTGRVKLLRFTLQAYCLKLAQIFIELSLTQLQKKL